MKGECQGVLNRSMEEADAINRGDIKAEKWKFDVGYEELVESMNEESKVMLDQIKADKLKPKRVSILPTVHIALPVVQSMTSSMDERETQKLTKHNRILEQIIDKKIKVEETGEYVVDDTVLFQKRRSSIMSIYDDPRPTYAAIGDIYKNYNTEICRGRQLNVSFRTKLDTTPSPFLVKEFKKRHIPLKHTKRLSKSTPNLKLQPICSRTKEYTPDEEYEIIPPQQQNQVKEINSFASLSSKSSIYSKRDIDLITKYYNHLENIITSPPSPSRKYTEEERKKVLEETKELVNKYQSISNKPIQIVRTIDTTVVYYYYIIVFT